VVATGAGAASRQILGTTVMGGMLAATLIAIFIIPVTFYVSQWFVRNRPAAATTTPPGSGSASAAGSSPGTAGLSEGTHR